MNQWDLPERTARCTIPQDLIKDPVFIAASVSQEKIEEAIAFKREAWKGMVELHQTQYYDYIEGQIEVLENALSIQTGYHPRTESP